MDTIMTLVFMFFPMVIWIGVISVVTRAVKGSFRRMPAGRTTQDRRRQNGGYTGGRPQPQKGLFEVRQVTRKKKVFNNGKEDFDTYTARGRKKDFVGGYDKKYTSAQSYRRARGMQYTHTYDGHEPWDKCLPKELDPWDKNFYV